MPSTLNLAGPLHGPLHGPRPRHMPHRDLCAGQEAHPSDDGRGPGAP